MLERRATVKFSMRYRNPVPTLPTELSTPIFAYVSNKMNFYQLRCVSCGNCATFRCESRELQLQLQLKRLLRFSCVTFDVTDVKLRFGGCLSAGEFDRGAAELTSFLRTGPICGQAGRPVAPAPGLSLSLSRRRRRGGSLVGILGNRLAGGRPSTGSPVSRSVPRPREGRTPGTALKNENKKTRAVKSQALDRPAVGRSGGRTAGRQTAEDRFVGPPSRRPRPPPTPLSDGRGWPRRSFL